MLLKKSFWLTVVLAASAHAAERPRIVGIANINVKVDNLEEARKFYSGVVGMEEAFQTRDAKGILGFRLQWKGGRTDDHAEWISMMVPDGYDWVE